MRHLPMLASGAFFVAGIILLGYRMTMLWKLLALRTRPCCGISALLALRRLSWRRRLGPGLARAEACCRLPSRAW